MVVVLVVVAGAGARCYTSLAAVLIDVVVANVGVCDVAGVALVRCCCCCCCCCC